VAEACAGLGMRVLATRASLPPKSAPRRDGPALTYPAESLRELLPLADALVLCVPSTPDTAGLLGREELELLPVGRSVLVNVSRGAVVDEDALYEALSSRRLFAAGIDVWFNYPPMFPTGDWSPTPVSKRHDFAALDNLVMSPHRGGAVGCAVGEAARLDALAELLRAAASGQPMPGRVDLAKGY